MNYAREDAVEVLRAVVSLRAYAPEHSGMLQDAFVHVGKQDRSAVADALQKLRVDPQDSTHGSRIALLASALPLLRSPDEKVWENIMRSAEVGLGMGKWRARDCRHIVQGAARWGVYPKGLPVSIEKYVGSSVGHAGQSDLAHLSAMLTAVPETYKSPLIQNVAQRAAILSDTLSGPTIGQLARHWFRAQYRNSEAVGALANQVGRVGEALELREAIPLLALLTNHKEHCKAEIVSVLLTQIAEKIEDSDAEVLILLMKALGQLEESLRLALHAEWGLVVDSVSEQLQGILSAATKDTAMLSVETSTVLLNRYFGMLDRRSQQETLSADAIKGLQAFASYVIERAEDFVADENPPFTIIQPLIQADLKETTEAALVILREASDQGVALPTLNIFKFILLLCDREVHDPKVYYFLRKSFVDTAANIPSVQLCAALKCFVITQNALWPRVDSMPAEDLAKIKEEREDDMLAEDSPFLETADEKDDRELWLDLLETVILGHQAKDMRFCINVTRGMHELGHNRDSFFDSMACYMVNQMESANPTTLSRSTAAVCLEALTKHKKLDARPDLEAFLNKVMDSGIKAEPAKPSKWMHDNDPSAIMTPLTPEQQKMREILDEMRVTRSADTTKLENLSTKYAKMIGQARLDDVAELFAVFADKVYKNDKLLNDVLKQLLANGSAEKMAPFGISLILHSLAQIRFAYHVTTKKFISAITEEQWASFDAQSLSIVIAAMAKMSIRIQAPLMMIGEKIIALAKSLTPLDVAQVIGGLQSLGFHEEAVMNALIARASDAANEFSSSQIAYLMTAPQIGRLLNDSALAMPLIQRCVYFQHSLSANEKQRITNNLRRSTLPKDLLTSTASALEIAPSMGSAGARRALTA